MEEKCGRDVKTKDNVTLEILWYIVVLLVPVLLKEWEAKKNTYNLKLDMHGLQTTTSSTSKLRKLRHYQKFEFGQAESWGG